MTRQIKGRHFPLVMAHRGGTAHGEENSSSAVRASLRYLPDVLEIDIRKSVDQVLFCHHGNIAMSLFLVLIGRVLTFQTICRLIRKVESLDDILKTIQETKSDVIVLLDIKTPSITAGDLSGTLVGFHIERIWIAAWSLRRLEQLRKGLGARFVYILNRPVFPGSLEKTVGVADVIQFVPHHWKKEIIDMARRLGLEVALFLLFSPRGKKFRLAARYKSLWFLYEDVSSVMYCASEVS